MFDVHKPSDAPKMRTYTSLTLLLVIFKFTSINAQTDKLSIEVFYESLCSDSWYFITHQLVPSWDRIAPYVNLKFVPFGKSNSLNDGVGFVCQHGPEECKGNRLQSCFLAEIPDQSKQVKYVECFMTKWVNRRKKPDELGQECTENADLDFDRINKECYSTTLGTSLQVEAEKETAKIHPKFIPTIVYNGTFSQELQDGSMVNFKGVVCGILQKNNPDVWLKIC